MADASIIKEFLVALGFKVDDAKLKKFSTGIDTATKFVGKLAAGVEGMATAVETAVVKVSSQFENLYYASKRLKDTVEDIRGFSFAMGQVGSTGKAGLQAMENVAEFLRSNPGGARFFQGLGVDLQFVDGQAKVTSDTMTKLAAVFRSMPYAQAKVYAGVLGIDPNTLQAMLRGTDAAQSKFHDLAQRMGVDQDAAAAASKNFMNDLRELLAVITLTFDRVVLKLQPITDQVVKGLEDLDGATQGWSTALIVLAGILLPLLAVLDPIWVILAGVALLLTQVDWSAWSGPLGEVSAAFDSLKEAVGEVWEIFEPFWNVMKQSIGDGTSKAFSTFLSYVATMLKLMADAIRIVVDLLTGNWSKAWRDAGQAGRDALNGIIDLMRKGIETAKAFWNMGHNDPNKPASNDNRPAAAAVAATNVATGAAAHIQDFLEKHGFAKQARGMTAGIFAESKFNSNAVNPTSGAFGIGQWLGKRKAELFKRYGPNPTLDQQLEFMVSELTGSEAGAGNVIKRQSGDKGALAAYIEKFMRPGAGTAGDLDRGLAYLSRPAALTSGSAKAGAPVQMAQTTTIHVHGNDPQATGKAVASEQARVNDAMVRNLKVAAS